MPHPPDVQRDERISSFVFRPEHLVKKTQKIHFNRLIPRRAPGVERGRLETSICRSSALDEASVWSICASHFDTHSPKPAIGRCDALAAVVYDVGLSFDADGVPYLQHANIIGWRDAPNEPDENIKHFWMDQAQRMAPHFAFIARGIGGGAVFPGR
jgi:hypothetical protein